MLDAGESNPDAAADTDSEDQDPLESVISAHDAKGLAWNNRLLQLHPKTVDSNLKLRHSFSEAFSISWNHSRPKAIGQMHSSVGPCGVYVACQRPSEQNSQVRVSRFSQCN